MNRECNIKFFAGLLVLLLSGCVSTNEKPQATQVKTNETSQTRFVTVEKEYTPQLWSHHKQLNESPAVCAQKGVQILNSLGFTSVVKNGNYVYGNHSQNRAAIKCVTAYEKTFVYLAVAGADVKLVEKLRNQISWKL
ncbi:hypothetical protein [Thalassotalea fusca]